MSEENPNRKPPLCHLCAHTEKSILDLPEQQHNRVNLHQLHDQSCRVIARQINEGRGEVAAPSLLTGWEHFMLPQTKLLANSTAFMALAKNVHFWRKKWVISSFTLWPCLHMVLRSISGEPITAQNLCCATWVIISILEYLLKVNFVRALEYTSKIDNLKANKL